MLARGRPAAAVPHCRAGQPPKRRRQTRTAGTPATRTPQAAEARGPLWRGRFGPGRSARSSRSSRRVTVTTPWVHVSLPRRTGCSDDAHLARRATRIRLSQVSAASTSRDRARRVATCSVRPVVRPRPDACGACLRQRFKPSPAGRVGVVHPRPRRIGPRQRRRLPSSLELCRVQLTPFSCPRPTDRRTGGQRTPATVVLAVRSRREERRGSARTTETCRSIHGEKTGRVSGKSDGAIPVRVLRARGLSDPWRGDRSSRPM